MALQNVNALKGEMGRRNANKRNEEHVHHHSQALNDYRHGKRRTEHDLHRTVTNNGDDGDVGDQAISSMTYVDSNTELPPIANKHVTAMTNEFVMSLPEVQSRQKQGSIDQTGGMGGQS